MTQQQSLFVIAMVSAVNVKYHFEYLDRERAAGTLTSVTNNPQ